VTIRVITPTDGSKAVTFAWDEAQVILDDGMLIDVPPGSALEAAVGLANLATAGTRQLASVSNGGGGTGWTSN
jgi:hypothetical protein